MNKKKIKKLKIPIREALNGTGKFTEKECKDLADWVIQYTIDWFKQKKKGEQ